MFSRLLLLMLVTFPCTELGLADALSDVDRGYALINEGKIDEALAVLSSAISSGELADIPLAAAYLNRSSAYHEKGEYELTEKDAALGLSVVEGKYEGARIHGRLWLNLGLSFSERDRGEQAEEAYTNGLHVSGQDTYATFRLLGARAWVRFDKGDYEGSLQDAERSVSIDEYYLEGMFLKHAIFIKKEMYEEAITELYDIVRRAYDPLLTAQVMNGIAWFLATCEIAEHRDGSTAVDMSKRALEILPGSYRAKRIELLDTLAASYAEIGRFDKSLEVEDEMSELVRSLDDQERQEAAELISWLEEASQKYRQEQPIRRACDGFL